MRTKKQRERFTTTACTFDKDAIAINAELNDVARMCRTGNMLKEILVKHFGGVEKEFKRWCRLNIDKDAKSVMRYIALAENQDMLESCGLIRLSEAYEVLGIDGNPQE